MSELSDYRKMRILLMFDLPSVEKEDISINQKFVKELKKIGFYMLQYSVYTRNIQLKCHNSCRIIHKQFVDYLIRKA